TFLPFAVGFVVALTAILKRVIPETAVRPQTLAVALQVVIWAVYIVAKERFGIDQQVFQNALDALTTILSGVSMFVLSSAATERAYQSLHKQDVPLVGVGQTKG